MARRRRTNIPPFLYDDETEGKFVMLVPELYESKAFQALSHAARNFYVLLAAHAASAEQRQCLYQTLSAYNDILQLGMNKEDLRVAVNGDTRRNIFSTLFVIPEKHLKRYGYSSQYANKLKNELIDAGFMCVKYGGKGRYTGWAQNTTVYGFSMTWKSKRS